MTLPLALRPPPFAPLTWRQLAKHLRSHPWLCNQARLRHPRASNAYCTRPYSRYVCEARLRPPVRLHYSTDDNHPRWREIAEHLIGHMPQVQSLSLESIVAQTDCPVAANSDDSSWVASDWLQERKHPLAPLVLATLLRDEFLVELIDVEPAAQLPLLSTEVVQ